MGLLGFAYRVATLPLSIAYTPIRLASYVLFGSDEDALRAKMEEEKKVFEKKEQELKERAVPIYVSGHPKDMQTVCASVDMKKADAKIRAICDAEKSSPLSVEMRGGGIFSRSVAPQRITPEVLRQMNEIGNILQKVFPPADSKSIIDSVFKETDPNYLTPKKTVLTNIVISSITQPIPVPLTGDQMTDIISAFNKTPDDKTLAKKIVNMLSPNNITGIKKVRAKDTLAMARNLCSDPTLREEELCKVLNPQQRQVQQPIYDPRYGYLRGGRTSRKNRRKTNKNKKTNKTSRRNKTNKR
jgi:hypothetical protein